MARTARRVPAADRREPALNLDTTAAQTLARALAPIGRHLGQPATRTLTSCLPRVVQRLWRARASVPRGLMDHVLVLD
jgi:hypothetical protein